MQKSFLILLLMGLACSHQCYAQNVLNLKIEKTMKLPTLPGSWKFLIKSTGGDSAKFTIGNAFTFLANGNYYHTEKGKIIERGNWNWNYDTLFLSKRVWNLDGAKSNPLVLDKTLKMYFTDKISFFTKITRNKETRIVMFRRTENVSDSLFR